MGWWTVGAEEAAEEADAGAAGDGSADCRRPTGATSPQVQERLLALDINVSGTVVKRAMKGAGAGAAPREPGASPGPAGRAAGLAGAELLLGLDQVVGATSALAAELQAGLAALPPSEPVRDDQTNRDAGSVQPAYNAAKKRTVPELGEKFDSVEQRRQGKNLPAMRTAQSSKASLSRKVVALTMLPCATDSARLDALGHWQEAPSKRWSVWDICPRRWISLPAN